MVFILPRLWFLWLRHSFHPPSRAPVLSTSSPTVLRGWCCYHVGCVCSPNMWCEGREATLLGSETNSSLCSKRRLNADRGEIIGLAASNDKCFEWRQQALWEVRQEWLKMLLLESQYSSAMSKDHRMCCGTGKSQVRQGDRLQLFVPLPFA